MHPLFAPFLLPSGTLDVVEALKFAQAHNLPFAVKGGGHSVAHLGLAKDGMTLDMSLMRR
jgi:FAD/FMN-containing dehydrogenase